MASWLGMHPPDHTHAENTHTRLMAPLCPGLPGWAGTRKVKPIWSLLEQKTVSGSGISRAICKSAPRYRQITMPAPHRSVFYRPDALPVAKPTVSKHWKHNASSPNCWMSRGMLRNYSWWLINVPGQNCHFVEITVFNTQYFMARSSWLTSQRIFMQYTMLMQTHWR